jgi:GNAT superfamily N-acetyltransferase
MIRDVSDAREAYVYNPEMTEASAREIWLGQKKGAVVVATNKQGLAIGTAKMGPNYPGPGSHVATASFVVSKGYQRLGVGRSLATYALDWAVAHGFSAMVFNAVVETNRSAVSLWQCLGFSIVGTVPEAFDHPAHGRVGLHIMYKSLRQP